jgi:hypothetical protein
LQEIDQTKKHNVVEFDRLALQDGFTPKLTLPFLSLFSKKNKPCKGY